MQEDVEKARAALAALSSWLESQEPTAHEPANPPEDGEPWTQAEGACARLVGKERGREALSHSVRRGAQAQGSVEELEADGAQGDALRNAALRALQVRSLPLPASLSTRTYPIR